jgi:hypothetical protein
MCLGGCSSAASDTANPYLTLSETFGIASGTEDDVDDSAQGTGVQVPFRLDLEVTLTNAHPDADVDTSFVAWVEIGNVRTTEQEDALFRSGYVQLATEVKLGNAFVLPVGTYVYNGPGVAGLTPVRLGSTENSAISPTQQITLVTPDVFLLYAQPPVSCESAAFVYTRDGEPLTSEPVADPDAPFGGATSSGGVKTLAQVSAYQCAPLRPGLFLRVGGLTDQTNEYLEGGTIEFVFNQQPDDDGNFAIVTIDQ